MQGTIIPVGQHNGRWMYVIRTDNHYVYGPVWSPLSVRWSRTVVYYPLNTIGKKKPQCPQPAAPPASTLYRLIDETARAKELSKAEGAS
jgi:hypothetical protein